MSARYEGDKTRPIEIRRIFRDDDGPVGRDLEARAVRVLAEARHRVGVRSGTLLASIRLERGRTAAGAYRDISAGVPGLTDYLGYHYYGSAPHVIRARRRSTLRFVSNGQIFYRREVHHPGNRPNRFLEEALRLA